MSKLNHEKAAVASAFVVFFQNHHLFQQSFSFSEHVKIVSKRVNLALQHLMLQIHPCELGHEVIQKCVQNADVMKRPLQSTNDGSIELRLILIKDCLLMNHCIDISTQAEKRTKPVAKLHQEWRFRRIKKGI